MASKRSSMIFRRDNRITTARQKIMSDREKTRASRSHPRTTRVSRVIRSQCTPANALGLPSVLLRLSVGGCILFCGSLYPRDVYYLKFTARKREAHLPGLALQKGHANFMGLLDSFGKGIWVFLFAIGKHFISHPV